RKAPLPLRGVAAKGRGHELAYALAHTGEIVAALERWFGIPFPYEKLDIIAVPDKGGAMENAGAITFREYLVLLDPARAPLEQRRIYFYVMAHELAHQWTGDLVTMRWWDDTWLNEAFATFMGNKIAAEVAPELGTSIAELERTHAAMGVDALVAARSIRQPVRDTNDISNAFDSITYVKGATVLSMFENFLGAAAFQAGVHDYLTAHAFGNATADDLLAALSRSSKRDAATAMRTFLDQPGVPLIEASLVCGAGKPKLHLEQSRYLPLGSTGSAASTWEVPVCARAPDGAKTITACTLLTTRAGDLDLPVRGCPAWVHPNAEGLGYYRWTLAPKDAANLAKAGLASMTPRERSSFAQSVRAGFSRGTTPAADAMRALAELVRDPNPAVAFAARDLIQSTADWFAPGSSTVGFARLFEGTLYRPLYAELGWQPKKGATETAERQSLRSGVVRLMTSYARDRAAREEATRRGLAYVGFGGDGALHPGAVDANLAGPALATAMEDGDASLFDALLALLGRTSDEVVRVRVLAALGSARRPELAARARGLALDPSLRGNEWATPLEVQLAKPETRDAAWAFFKEHLEAILARPSRAAHVITWAGVFCDEAHRSELQALYEARLSRLEGAPRTLAETLESMRLCVARKQAQEASAGAFFSSRGGGRR
ncbi:MAG TPA: M1 family aminopeptidase, partial [Byssovorax sp.]